MPMQIARFVFLSCLVSLTVAPLDAANQSNDDNIGRDASLRRALSLLATPVAAPIEVIDVGTLPTALRRVVQQSCAYVLKSVSRIYVNSACPVYLAAAENQFEAMKLAALLRHELAHIEGADEARAYAIEARTFRELLQDAPSHMLSRGMVYAASIDRRAAAAASVPMRTSTR